MDCTTSINTYLNMLAKEHGRNIKLKSYLDGLNLVFI
jgi:hypothetical protein